ncbi:caspase family protein [Micromonospora echinofusca]|uniref:wHTH domain-containing protein n=1 Tax=Micromonospora echinofusca TaxID=47858 RepID=UPI00342D95CD
MTVGAERQALLVGVSRYRDESIEDLLFVENDLAEVRRALEDAGYHTELHDSAATDGQSIDSAVELFLADAAPGATVLIFLSGHGVHNDGMDFLVPSGAMTRSYNFAERCVAINFDRYVERSQAGDVVVVVDACREGIHVREKGVASAAQWSRRKTLMAAERRISYLYACSPGERARYVSDGPNAFSLFSRAFSHVLGDRQAPATLDGIVEAIQEALDKLTADYECPRQRIRVIGEPADDMRIAQRPTRTERELDGEHPWVVAVREHIAWDRVAERYETVDLREGVTQLTRHLAELHAADLSALAEDPWIDPGFSLRMTARVRWLLATVLNADKLALSAAEAAYLVAFPFLQEAFWTRNAAALAATTAPSQAADHPDDDPVRERFRRFFHTHGRLVRRATRLAASEDVEAARGIRWWVFHRWLTRQPHCYDAQLITTLAGATGFAGQPENAVLEEVLSSVSLLRMLRALRSNVWSISSPEEGRDLPPCRYVASATECEQPVREQLLGYLLVAAHRFAVEVTSLPEVIADHLGVAQGVTPRDVIATLHAATWEARGRTRTLAAECTHPAVDVALKEHVAAVDELLAAIDAQTDGATPLAPLMDMPTHAASDRVRAVSGADGRRLYDSTGLRFHLADDRIQELLMGEQLYGDPALAIRELYQNALDACRYKAARLAFLRCEGRDSAQRWQGGISIRLGEDADGRAYLECADNGIGMGIRELRDVFSHAGVRFADLPEYIEEQSEWKRYGIELHANSRFGIGVLSYFMLADDISISTCRLRRSGLPGDRLEVQIAGPGSLFRVTNLGRGHETGTTVRLYLRPGAAKPSPVELLRRNLWLSDFDVTVTEPHATLPWEAGHLSVDAIESNREREHGTEVARTSTPSVWWCDTVGGVVADGLWVDEPIFGAVVNLTGPVAPQLTIDRKRMLSYDTKEVDRLLERELESLVSSPGVFSHEWLNVLALTKPRLADQAFARAVAVPVDPWSVGGIPNDIRIVGCFPVDRRIFSTDEDVATIDGLPYRPTLSRLPEALLAWRVVAWAKCGNVAGLQVPAEEELPLALPSDVHLLSANPALAHSERLADDDDFDDDYLDNPSREWLSNAHVVPLGHLALVSSLTGRSTRELAKRLTLLGYQVPDVGALPELPTPMDVALLRARGPGRSGWLGQGETVPPGHIVRHAVVGDLPVAEVAALLAAYGFTVPDVSRWPTEIGEQDLEILGINEADRTGWLQVTRPVPYRHALLLRKRLGLSIDHVADRLQRYGFSVDHLLGLRADLEEDGLVILSKDRDGVGPWLEEGGHVSLTHLIRTSAVTGTVLAHVADRFRLLGFHTPDVSSLHTVGSEAMITLLGGADYASQLDPARPIPAACVLRAAHSLGRSLLRVAAELVSLGFREPNIDDLARFTERELIEVLRPGGSTWLRLDRPVTAVRQLAAMTELNVDLAYVRSMLAALGITAAEASIPDSLSAEDRAIVENALEATVSEPVRGRRRVGAPAAPTNSVVVPRPPLLRIFRAAQRTSLGLDEVARRLKRFGFPLSDDELSAHVPDRDDLAIVVALDAVRQYCPPTSVTAIAVAAERSGLPVPTVVEHIERFGLRPDDASALPERISSVDARILALDFSGGDWTTKKAVPLQHVLALSQELELSVAEVADRLRLFGMRPPDVVLRYARQDTRVQAPALTV